MVVFVIVYTLCMMLMLVGPVETLRMILGGEKAVEGRGAQAPFGSQLGFNRSPIAKN